MRPESRDALRAAIAKARGWIDDIRLGRISSFAGIAERCGPGRTAHPPAGSPRLPIAPHHCGDRRWHRACGPHGHWPRQGPAVFVGRARAKDTALIVAPIAERALCEPVAVNSRIGLRPVEMEIEKRRAETGATLIVPPAINPGGIGRGDRNHTRPPRRSYANVAPCTLLEVFFLNRTFLSKP